MLKKPSQKERMPLARTSALLFHASCHPAANGWLRHSLHDASRQSVNGGALKSVRTSIPRADLNGRCALAGATCVWNGRGGACVPARTSAQRRFHAKIYLCTTYHARGFNDGCALGRATRSGTQVPTLPNSIILFRAIRP